MSSSPKLKHRSGTERHDIAVDETPLRDRDPVDRRTVGRSEVDEHEPITIGADLGMLTAHIRVVEGDRALRESAQNEPVRTEYNLLPVAEVKDAHCTIGFLHSTTHHHLAGANRRRCGEANLYGTHELPTFVAGDLSGCITQLPHQGFLDFGESSEIVLSQLDIEVVGHDRLPLHPDRP